MAEVRLTAEGVEKYEKRLEYLKTTARTGKGLRRPERKRGI